jgi:hypothetical protein
MFGGGYPVTSLKRDDPRTLRFLMMLASELRTADRHGRVLQVKAHEGDPGPTYLEQMASLVDEIRSLYEARQYDQANQLQKKLANWVARMGNDRDFEPASAKYEGAQLIEMWKKIWKLAEDVAKTKMVLEGNAGVIADRERVLDHP